MNIVVLVLRLVPGVLFVGHGLQKLLPSRFLPRLLAAGGARTTAAGFAQLSLEPALPFALLAGAAELAGGLLLATGLVTPLAVALLAAVMTVAILVVHLRNGIWAARGGFEFPLLMLATAWAVSGLGPGGYSLDRFAGVGDWAGIGWSASEPAKAGAAVAAGALAGFAVVVLARGRAHRERVHEHERGEPAAKAA